MTRRWRILVATVAVAAALVTLLSGCAVFRQIDAGPQIDVIGDLPVNVTVCASGSAGCPSNGASEVPAQSAGAQVLLGVLLRDATAVPARLASTSPTGLELVQSPSYTAELQRLSPAVPGTRWAGYISQAVFYQASQGPQAFTVPIPYRLLRDADGGPFAGSLASVIVVGARVASQAGPETRPVVCGPSLTALYDELPPPSSGDDVWVICSDSSYGAGFATRDLGVVNGALASGPAGRVETLPFLVRYAGTATPAADFRLSASTDLPGATVAVTPATLVPATDSAAVASVAVGIPAGARPGRYGVTLTARLANGQARSGSGTLTVLAGPAAGDGGGPSARLRLTTVLPRRLSARIARRRGIAVLIGADRVGVARVQLFQGRARKPKASKRVRLRVPGPTKVVLRSAKLRRGPYRIVIRTDGRTFVRRGALAK